MSNFGKYLANYEMAQMDAFKAAKFKLSEMIDNSETKSIDFETTRVMKIKADADFEDVTTNLISVSKVDEEIAFMDDNGYIYYLNELSMNDVIEIVANIVLKINY